MKGPAARVGDFTSHPGVIAPPGAAASPYSIVVIGGAAAARVGDTHTCALPPSAGPHPPNIVAEGSASVLISGGPAARQFDKTGCGAVILTGALNVLIGD